MSQSDQSDLKKLLMSVREVLEDPNHWTQGENARNRAGDPVDPKGKAAVCWCLVGVLEMVKFEHNLSWELRGRLQSLFQDQTGEGFTTYNDSHTHAEVIQTLDRLIEQL